MPLKIALVLTADCGLQTARRPRVLAARCESFRLPAPSQKKVFFDPQEAYLMHPDDVSQS
ncbi:hypothetical protein VPNG_00481 [Cytospora leucostoma]|uniref:Uncharacterized protein n=1 Tax=Cytospora leucostoma TaxID=1230097 RepID=A0A423XNF5_9PEZI|nr:hypothetical protein VPNG_00481 [Cytospora leucostoma]